MLLVLWRNKPFGQSGRKRSVPQKRLSIFMVGILSFGNAIGVLDVGCIQGGMKGIRSFKYLEQLHKTQISTNHLTVFKLISIVRPTRCTNVLLTYSMVQSPSWEAKWFAASQEIPRISLNPKVHYHTHKRPPPVSILGQPNPVPIHTSHVLEIHPNIIYPSTPRSPHCTNVLNLFYFRMTIYKFRTVIPSIIRSSRLYIQQQAFVRQTAVFFDKCLLLYVQSWTPNDGRKDSPKHVECHSKLNKFDTMVQWGDLGVDR